VICDSQDDQLDQRPYRTFNNTVESLTHLVRSTYRDMQENITGNHPRIYRQVRAGAEIATIALSKDIPYPGTALSKALDSIPVIRQVLIYPPLIFNPPMNKRSGVFRAGQPQPAGLCQNLQNGRLAVLPGQSRPAGDHGATSRSISSSWGLRCATCSKWPTTKI
jgi:hypothetical protein